MNFIKFYADSRTIAREKFVYKVQILCRIRDDINYLDPVVKPRDDKKGEPCSTGPWPRDDKEHACGAMDPGLRRDDDKKRKVREKTVTPWLDHGAQVMRVLCASTDNLLSSRGSIATVACHPGAGRDPLRRRHLCRRAATPHLHFAL